MSYQNPIPVVIVEETQTFDMETALRDAQRHAILYPPYTGPRWCHACCDAVECLITPFCNCCERSGCAIL